MPNYAAEGTTFTFAGTTYCLRSLSFDQTTDELDVTCMSDTEKKYESGTTDSTLTFECLGFAPPAIGATGSGVITWQGGATTLTIPGVVTSRSIGASVGGEIVSNVTVRPTGAIT